MNNARAAYSLSGFFRLAWPGLELATPRYKSQYCDHTANPICLLLIPSSLTETYWLCLKHLLFKKYGVPQSLLQHCWDGAKLYLRAY